MFETRRRDRFPALPSLSLLATLLVFAALPAWAASAHRAKGRVVERLRWELRVLGSTAGIAEVTVGKTRRWKGHRVVPVYATVRSIGFFSHVFPVDDRMVSLVSDTPARRPLRTEFELRRKAHRRHYEWIADWKHRRFRGKRVDVKNGKTRKRGLDVKVPSDTHDGLSWILRVRAVDWAHTRRFVFHAHSGNYLYTARVDKVGVEDAWSPVGLYHAYKLHIVVTRKGGKPFHREADVWLSTGPRRLPLRIQIDLKIGHVDALLVAAQSDGGRAPTTASAH